MEQNENKDGFSYTYSAKEQEEIQRIRKKYIMSKAVTGEDKMERLRRLDESVTQKGTVVALILGIIGSLILGTGMSLSMTELSNLFANSIQAMIVGIGVGAIGIVLIALAYPVYRMITRAERKRVTPEILRLTEELMK